MDFAKLRYALGAIPRRFVQPRVCPSCGTHQSSRVDRKGFHELRRCASCALLFRWPYETASEMARFYQREYAQPGLTTDLPDTEMLNHLMASGFKGSDKDFSRVVNLFEGLGIPSKARILDYGANWGYGVWQFREAGYDAVGFELSLPRAEFARHLGVDVFKEWATTAAQGPFDVVFSSHVLEHTPNPGSALSDQMAALRPGGWLVALFPNGSEPFRRAKPDNFHRLWGRVHPVMLNDAFVTVVLGDQLVFRGSLSGSDLASIRRLTELKSVVGNVSGSEMLVIARKETDPAGSPQQGQRHSSTIMHGALC